MRVEIIPELDEVRDQAQAAFIARDADGYLRMFSREVLYRQADGTTVPYEQLAADIERQMRVIALFDISRTRESCEASGDTVVEVVTQNTSITASAFFLITRTIQVTRKGKYVWTKTVAGWRVVEVEILLEDVQSHWALGFVKPRRI